MVFPLIKVQAIQISAFPHLGLAVILRLQASLLQWAKRHFSILPKTAEAHTAIYHRVSHTLLQQANPGALWL